MKQKAKMKVTAFFRTETGNWRAEGQIIDHPRIGTTGPHATTSTIESINFKEGRMETLNTTYEMIK